jgi:hypothetical protein
MKQLTVYCSRDLEKRVISAFDEVDLEGYVHLGGATGHKFLPGDQVPRTMTWEASVFVVPSAPEDRIARVVDSLKLYAGSCEIEPCIRIVTSDVEQAY